MNPTEIFALLAVVQYGNISTAAEKMYTSQPALSKNIQSLEEKLGYQLLQRRKGVRNVTLTERGEVFIELAEKWSRLWNEMQTVGDILDRQMIRVSAINSLVSYVINPVINSYLNTYPSIYISIESQHSYTSISRVLSGILDCAFVCNVSPMRGLKAIPLWNEPMVLVAGEGVITSEKMTPDILDDRQELLVPWNNEFEEWHNYWFGAKRNAILQTDHMASLEQIMSNRNRWMIAPITAAKKIAAASGARIASITPHPERRVFFIYSSSVSEPMKNLVNHILASLSDTKEVQLSPERFII